METYLNFTYFHLYVPLLLFWMELVSWIWRVHFRPHSIWTPQEPSLSGSFGHLKEEKCTERVELPRYYCKWCYESLNQKGIWKSLMIAMNPQKKTLHYFSLGLSISDFSSSPGASAIFSNCQDQIKKRYYCTLESMVHSYCIRSKLLPNLSKHQQLEMLYEVFNAF